MMRIRYIGSATIREFSEVDIANTFHLVSRGGISIDTRKSREITVSNRLATKLMDTNEFVLVGVDPEGDGDDPSEVLPAPDMSTPLIENPGEPSGLPIPPAPPAVVTAAHRARKS